MTTLTGSALRRYHEATKHSPLSVAASRRRLDWSVLLRRSVKTGVMWRATCPWTR